jgi:penicillin amidase
VNGYIATLDEKTLPVEFRILQYKPREWTAADSVVVGKILADALSSTWRNDLVRASIENMPKDKLADLTNQVTTHDVILFGKDVAVAERRAAKFASHTDLEATLAKAQKIEDTRETSLSRIGFYAEELAASNNWVISGKRTADGKPILANDPHLRPSAPGIWYLTHLTTPTMRVSGATFPGVPGVVLGHNEHIAWGATNVGPDVQDLYVEKITAAGPGGAESSDTPKGPQRVEVRREEIRVRKNLANAETVAREFEVRSTRNGPIILEEGGRSYALKWTASDPKNSEFESFYFLNRAKDWNEFKKSLRSYRGATQNFVYADVKGNIGWYAAGLIPIRKTGDGSMPYDGSTDDGEWVGSIPFEELPHLYNPPEGFIVTANQRIVGTSYKYTQLSRDAAPPWRARRIVDLLKGDSKVTMDKVAEIQRDSYNIPLLRLASEIVRQKAASAETLELLKTWDGKMSPDSQAALVVNEIRQCIAGRIADANKPAPVSAVRERILDWAIRDASPRWLPGKFADYPSLIRVCDDEWKTALTGRLGPDRAKWVWGSMSVSRFPHPLAAAPFIGGQFATPQIGLEGSGQSPNVASFVSMRHIASPGNWDATRHVIPLGQSGDPLSPHYKDQFEIWRSGSAAVFPFTKRAVDAGTRVVLEFQPGS